MAHQIVLAFGLAAALAATGQRGSVPVGQPTYLVLSSRMYIDKPAKPEPLVIAPPLTVAILICAIGTVVMGAYPEPWVRAVMHAVGGLF